ncbi:hypothetical protein H0H81_010598 [Sphagnurus paluster]|uniref:Uncharacterized protein n=1 Tax=Sphagnurus paluster TaxID=117069 RepID=A0A9P7GKF3_9AGAR|nr:hypothetical protein H0H81_010598 [Sphagnurus paluster]
MLIPMRLISEVQNPPRPDRHGERLARPGHVAGVSASVTKWGGQLGLGFSIHEREVRTEADIRGLGTQEGSGCQRSVFAASLTALCESSAECLE